MRTEAVRAGRCRDGPPGPSIVVWELTRACPYACRHCRTEVDRHRDPRELSTLEAMRVMNEIRRLGRPELVLGGGEPLGRPDLDDLVRHASRIGLRPTLHTPGTARHPDRDLPRLGALGLAGVSTGLDDNRSSRHDELRGSPGSFRKAVGVLEAARAAGIPVEVWTLVTRRNVGAAGELVPLLRELGVRRWTVSILVPTPPAREEDVPDPEDVDSLIRELSRRSREAPFSLRWAGASRAAGVCAGSAEPGSSPDLFPGAGDGILHIAADGSVHPSPFLPVVLGHVRRDDLATLYRESSLLESLRDRNLLDGPRGACELRTAREGAR